LWCSKEQIYVEGAWGELAGVFGIPLAVLIAGGGVFWAARGFRSN
jgi:hypothetical protein